MKLLGEILMSAKHIDRRRFIVKRACALIMVTALFAAVDGQVASADEVYNTNSKPPTDGRVGSNYTPAYAVNQVQFWHDFRPKVVEKELAAAQRHFGIKTLRVYLHNINFDEEKDVFMANLEKFLTICEKHGIKPGFVFFDDCHRDDGIFLDKPTTPVKGWHNGRWAWCPQVRDRDPEDLQKFKPYVQEVVRAHRTDKRVLFWEVFNEPTPLFRKTKWGKYSDQLKRAGYQWAKDVKPIQPVLNCNFTQGEAWTDSDVSDIVDSHLYQSVGPAWDKKADANTKKGTVITEAGARWYGPRRDFGEPCSVLHWLEDRRTAGKSTPGVYLCWELMAGNTNTRWHWVDKAGNPEPTMPWCGLMWPDATPVSLAESEASLRYTTGQGRALFFDDFQDSRFPQRPGWKVSGNTPGVLRVSPGPRMVTGDPEWNDYLVESLVMLKDSTCSALLMVRLNYPQAGNTKSGGHYYVGFDTKTLYLGKTINNDWQTLVTYDLGRLECKVVAGVWNHIRVEANGNRLRVWFNRMHPSSDPENGLRIEYTDTDMPVLSGNIGVMAVRADAWYDNLVVIPVQEAKRAERTEMPQQEPQGDGLRPAP